MVRKHIYFDGRVQGVGFRYHAVFKGRKLGLTGWVKNLYDGRVEMEVQGTEFKIRELIFLLEHERFIRIESMETEEIALVEDEREFTEKW